MILTLVILAVLGLCLGSFINALVWRVHEQGKGRKGKNMSIMRGRSMCPACKHELAAKDLIPVFSWLYLRGHCRYCKKKIDDNPWVEATLPVIFILSYLLWPVDFSSAGQWLLFGSWLLSSVGLLALAVYDFRWMLLPNRILYPTLAVAAAGRLGYIIFYTSDKAHQIEMWALSLVVASGVFLLLFIVSQGRWIGFGDVRLGLITGTLLGTPAKSFLMIFLASILGTLFVLPAMLNGKKSANSRLPYGPFLIMATAIVLLFGDSILNWYKSHFI